MTSMVIEPAAARHHRSETVKRTFGPGRSAGTATTDPVRAAASHRSESCDVLVELAVAEVQSHHVDARPQHLIEDIRRITCRPQRGHDLRSSVHA